MKKKTKRKIFFLAIDALLAAVVLLDLAPSEKAAEEIVDDAACE